MFGFEIIETGEFLDTKDVTIDCVLKNPATRIDDNEDGSMLFNMVFPATDKIKKIFNFPLNVDFYRQPPAELAVKLHYPSEGSVLWTGTMVAKFARPDEIEVSVGIGRGDFNYLAEGKKIADLVPDEIHNVGHVEQVRDSVSGIVHDMAIIDGFDDIPNKVYPETNFAIFPVKIEEMCSSMGNAFNNAYYNTSSNINMWDIDLQRFMRPLLTGNQFLLISNIDETETHTHHLTYLLPYNIFSPYPYNSWILKNIFSALGYTIENNKFETDPDLKRLTVYNIQTLNRLNNKNEGPWTQQIYGDPDYGNYTLTTKRYLYALQPDISFNLRNHVPDVDVKNYVRALENMFFFRFFFDHNTRSAKMIFLRDIVNSTDYEDITDRVIRIQERRIDREEISKLVQEFDSNDGNSAVVKTKEEIDKFDRIADVWYQGDLPANAFGQFENKISYGQLQKKWFVCSSFADDFNHVSTWDLLAFEHYFEKKLLNEGKEWTSQASAILCSHFVDYKPGTSFVKYAWHLASIKQALRFYNAYKTEENTCGLRFLFYRGMQKGNMLTYYEDNSIYLKSPNNQYYDLAFLYLTDYGCTAAEATQIMQYMNTHPARGNAVSYLLNYDADFASTANVGFTFVAIELFLNSYFSLVPIIVQDGDFEKVYPLGTNDVYDGQLNKIPEANLSLKWDGDYGIYKMYAKDFIRFYNNAIPVTIQFKPRLSDLLMKFEQWKRVNGVDYLVDEIRFSVRNEDISIAEMDALSR
jgi:hypothetical protein